MSSLFTEILDKIDEIPASRKDIVRLLDKMEHDLQAAENEEAADWIIKKVHEAILDGCTALIAAHGYRVKAGPWHHYVTVRFAQLTLPEHEKLLDRADVLRRRRHQVTYGTSYTVSEEEARGAFELVHQLAPILREAARKALARTGSEQK